MREQYQYPCSHGNMFKKLFCAALQPLAVKRLLECGCWAAQRLSGQLCLVQDLGGGIYFIVLVTKWLLGKVFFPPLRKQPDAQEYPKLFPHSRIQPQTPRLQIPNISVWLFWFLGSAKACFRGELSLSVWEEEPVAVWWAGWGHSLCLPHGHCGLSCLSLCSCGTVPSVTMSLLLSPRLDWPPLHTPWVRALPGAARGGTSSVCS